MIALPSAEDVEHYGVPTEPRDLGIPLIADDEPVSRVRVLETGSVSYWSRGDVDVHILDAKQRGVTAGHLDSLEPQAVLAVALRERRALRRHLQRGGVHTTGSGLVLFQQQQPRLLISRRP